MAYSQFFLDFYLNFHKAEIRQNIKKLQVSFYAADVTKNM